MSEDPTPKQPNDDTTRLLGLILDRLNTIDARLDSIDSRLIAVEGSRDTVGKLDRLILDVAQTHEEIRNLKDEMMGNNLQLRADIRELKRGHLRIEEWIDQREAEKK